MNDKSRNSLIVSEDVLNVGAKSRKRYELNKLNIHHNDGEQYMSYVKISRKQHELVKSMKQSGKSIQSRSMNRVLGNFKSLHVQPYEVFVEEEQKKKLHEHWLQLTTEDLPAFYVNWRERKKQLWEITQSLMQEMKAKLECRIEDKEKDNSGVPDEEEENSGVPEEEEENSGVAEEEEENSGVPEEEEENYGVAEEEEENSGVPEEEEENYGVLEEEEENIGVHIGVHNQEEENSGFQDEEEEDTGVQDEEEESTGTEDQEEENTGVLDEKKETTESPPQDQKENVATNHESPSQDQLENVATHHESNINDDEDSTHGENVTTNHESNIKNDEECAHGSPCDQSPEQITPLSGSHELNHLDVDPEKNHAAPKSDNSSSDVCENPWKMNSADDTVNQEVPFSSGGDVWQAISRPHSHYDCTAGHEFTTSGLALMNPQVNQDQQTQLIDMESDLREEYMRNDMLHRQPDNGSLSYQNQDRNDLLQSLFKGREMSYHQEQKQTGLHLQPPNNSMMAGDGQFPGHFQQHLESSLPLEQGRKRLNEFFLQQNTSDNDYSDRGRYLIPRQENLQLGNMHNWNVNPVRISEPLETHLNDGQLSSHNWFCGEHQVRGGWTSSGGVSIQSQSIGNGSNADQSLLSVLPSCAQLRSVNPYDPVGPNEQFISPGNFGLMAGGVAPEISNTLPNPTHPLDYLGGRDSVMPDDMGWMNLPHQNPALHDPMGKPYLRFWNQ